MTKKLDEVGIWTEVKLAILRDYTAAYTTILKSQPSIRHFAYIDGFAGAGYHISRRTGLEIKGSPAIALDLGFDHYHFIDLDGQRIELLTELAGDRSDVSVYTEDSNRALLDEVFPKCRYEDYRRALCLLDPYDLNPDWRVVEAAGQMRSIELFVNFMIMDANRNVFSRKGPDEIPQSQIERMNRFWGDESWRTTAYVQNPGLFGEITEKTRNGEIAEAYRQRLQTVAGFRHVPPPLAMVNSSGAVLYYLFFATHNETGARIVRSIFKKFRDRGEGCV